MTHLNAEFESWIGRTLIDESGHKIGKIDDIYTDDDTGQPEWLSVHTGLFGTNVSFVPVEGASPCGDGEVQVRFAKEQVKDAPNAGRDGVLSPEEEARLYAHYGYDYDQERVRLQRWMDRERSTTPGQLDLDEPARQPIGRFGTEPVAADVERGPVGSDLGRRPMDEDDTVIHLEDSRQGTVPDDPHGWDDDDLVGQRPALADRRMDPSEAGGRTRRR